MLMPMQKQKLHDHDSYNLERKKMAANKPEALPLPAPQAVSSNTQVACAEVDCIVVMPISDGTEVVMGNEKQQGEVDKEKEEEEGEVEHKHTHKHEHQHVDKVDRLAQVLFSAMSCPAGASDSSTAVAPTDWFWSAL
jgi:hypothetical protein